MWMKPLLSKRKNIPNSSSPTLIPSSHTYSSLLRPLTSKDHSPSWTQLVYVGTNGSLVTTAYRKQTQVDQYLQWDSHHKISKKYSVFSTLTLRAQTVSSDLQLLGQELQQSRTTLTRCNYLDWVFHRLQTKLDNQLSLQHHNNKPNTHKDVNNTKDIFIVVSYSRGLSENFKNQYLSIKFTWT